MKRKKSNKKLLCISDHIDDSKPEDKSNYLKHMTNGLYIGIKMGVMKFPVNLALIYIELLFASYLNELAKSSGVTNYNGVSPESYFQLMKPIHEYFMKMPELYTIIIGPILEELFFRGILRGGIKGILETIFPIQSSIFKKFANTSSAILSSLEFSAAHKYSLKLNKFYIGMDYCLMDDELEAGLIPSIASHIVNNALATAMETRPFSILAISMGTLGMTLLKTVPEKKGNSDAKNVFVSR